MYSSDNTEVQFKTIRVHFMDKLSLCTHAYVAIYHGKSCSDTRRQAHIYRPQRSWGKVIFSQACVILFTGGGCVWLSACWDTTTLRTRQHPPRPGAPRCRACWEIQSTCRRYSSYWNEILLNICLLYDHDNHIFTARNEFGTRLCFYTCL